MTSANPTLATPVLKRNAAANEDITCMQISTYYPQSHHREEIKTPICSSEMKYVLLERLRKEIISKLARKGKRKRGDNHRYQHSSISSPPRNVYEIVLRSRLKCGINQCTRALEDELLPPSLIILARDVRPSIIFEHISLYAHIRNIPILIFPGKASLELGEAVGIRTLAALTLLPRDGKSFLPFKGDETKMNEWEEYNIEIDSFVSYVISKIPL